MKHIPRSELIANAGDTGNPNATPTATANVASTANEATAEVAVAQVTAVDSDEDEIFSFVSNINNNTEEMVLSVPNKKSV